MFVRRLAIAGALALSTLLLGCSSLITAYLINELLNDKAPKYNWTGTVQDSGGNPLPGLDVVIEGKVSGDTDIATFSGETDSTGNFTISFRWSSEVDYSIKVYDSAENQVYTQTIGKIPEGDRSSGITVNGTFAQLSGVVRSSAGVPISGAVVVAASAASLTATPSVLKSGDKPAYAITNDAGVFTINGTISRFGIVSAFHPDYGFAYAYGEDSDGNGQLPLNVNMGSTGSFDVNAQVVDGFGTPIANRVLDPAQQFRLVGRQPFNLSATMDQVRTDNSLFPAMSGAPSDQHPADFVFTVAATGNNGITSGLNDVPGGSYSISLLKLTTDDPATAVVVGENPVVLAADKTIVVRVN